MKNKWIAALALAGLLLTTGAYAESTPSETAAHVQAEAAAEGKPGAINPATDQRVPANTN